MKNYILKLYIGINLTISHMTIIYIVVKIRGQSL